MTTTQHPSSAALFPNFTPFTISVKPSINIFGVRGGSGPALLLLHGFPQSHHIWHRVAQQLSAHYTVVALDLRGHGASTRVPSTSGKHTEYAKSSMAADCIAVMAALGFPRFYLCAHDRGARVGHKLCVDYPAAVEKAIFLDISPTRAMFQKTDQKFATAYFHWFFLIQAEPFPEDIIAAAPRRFTEGLMGQRYGGLKAFDKQALEYYIGVMEDRDAVHSMCEDYRAAASRDLEEAEQDEKEGKLIQCPLRVLWGKNGVIETCFDAVEDWKKVSANGDVAGHSVNSGHYIPEHAPQELLTEIMDFFM